MGHPGQGGRTLPFCQQERRKQQLGDQLFLFPPARVTFISPPRPARAWKSPRGLSSGLRCQTMILLPYSGNSKDSLLLRMAEHLQMPLDPHTYGAILFHLSRASFPWVLLSFSVRTCVPWPLSVCMKPLTPGSPSISPCNLYPRAGGGDSQWWLFPSYCIARKYSECPWEPAWASFLMTASPWNHFMLLTHKFITLNKLYIWSKIQTKWKIGLLLSFLKRFCY